MAESGRRKTIRCAIYTRKSSEEGLDQDFNSLHAQREACEAFIASQKHEGWQVLRAAYDDGGYSGGSTERPALQQLLADIASGGIDVVVVYKVDRLTRSLADFAKIVEVFDRHGVSFVSVTQAFNTTTSMGRLTLNVLLSFAQFEREVTGERIRDKIAASKKKGLWMGGFVPIGYEAAGRTLTINESEAETIRTIYARYLELRSVDALKAELDERGFRTKHRPGRSGRMTGGTPFSRGHLYRLLSNPLYAGKIEHRGKTYSGQHPAIIDQPTFDEVQAALAANSHARLVKAYSKDPALLTGLLFDAQGQRLVATHATKQGRRYRYYRTPPGSGRRHDRVRNSRSDTVEIASGSVSRPWRLPAAEIEEVVIRVLLEVLSDEHWLAERVHSPAASIADRQATTGRAHDLTAQLQANDPIARRGAILLLVRRVVLSETTVSVDFSADAIRGSVSPPTEETSSSNVEDGQASAMVHVERALRIRHRGAETRLVVEGGSAQDPEPDPTLIRAVAQAHRWWQDLVSRRYATLRDLSGAYSTNERYAASVLRLAFLPSDVTRRILDGTQPAEMTLHRRLKDV